MGDKNKTYWRDGLSIDETKVSVIVVGLVATLIFSGFMYFRSGDITDNLRMVLLTLIYAVAGVNITTELTSAIAGKMSQAPQQQPIQPAPNPSYNPYLQPNQNNQQPPFSVGDKQ